MRWSALNLSWAEAPVAVGLLVWNPMPASCQERPTSLPVGRLNDSAGRRLLMLRGILHNLRGRLTSVDKGPREAIMYFRALVLFLSRLK